MSSFLDLLFFVFPVILLVSPAWGYLVMRYKIDMRRQIADENQYVYESIVEICEKMISGINANNQQKRVDRQMESLNKLFMNPQKGDKVPGYIIDEPGNNPDLPQHHGRVFAKGEKCTKPAVPPKNPVEKQTPIEDIPKEINHPAGRIYF